MYFFYFFYIHRHSLSLMRSDVTIQFKCAHVRVCADTKAFWTCAAFELTCRYSLTPIRPRYTRHYTVISVSDFLGSFYFCYLIYIVSDFLYYLMYVVIVHLCYFVDCFCFYCHFCDLIPSVDFYCYCWFQGFFFHHFGWFLSLLFISVVIWILLSLSTAVVDCRNFPSKLACLLLLWSDRRAWPEPVGWPKAEGQPGSGRLRQQGHLPARRPALGCGRPRGQAHLWGVHQAPAAGKVHHPGHAPTPGTCAEKSKVLLLLQYYYCCIAVPVVAPLQIFFFSATRLSLRRCESAGDKLGIWRIRLELEVEMSFIMTRW